MWKRVLLGVTCALILVILAGAGFLVLRKPNMAPPRDVRVSMVPERVERGKYLFEHVFDCSGCHSARDFTRLSGPVKPDGIGVGFVFPDQMGLPGRLVASNLTPDPETGLGRWSDGEIIRAIREGVNREGNALFPFMPYPSYRNMSDDDVEAIVAYLRSIPPVRNPLPRSELALPVALMTKAVPQPLTGPVPPPSREDSVAYGRYLVRVGDCAGCHSMKVRGESIPEMDLAGGFELRLPEGVVVSANITPDLETGIGAWTEDGFVARFQQYRDFVQNGAPTVSRHEFTLMPWLAFSQMDEGDLRAIYRYLRTVKPVRHKVTTHPEASVAVR